MAFEATAQIVAGLTGGIASGKSTVAKMLAASGARIVDADRIAREVVRPGRAAWQEIVRHFGRVILLPDGQIDRSALGNIIFNEPKSQRALNAIVHPRVLERMQRAVRQLAAEHPDAPVIVDVPLLIESGWHASLPIIILVYVPEALQQTRLMKRDGLSAADAMARIRSQMPIETKRHHADFIIDNSGTLAATQKQVHAVYAQLLAGIGPSPLAPRPSSP